MRTINILLADDHALVREAFHNILTLEKDIQIIGSVANGKQAVAMFKKLKPDVLLMDIAMPVLNGLEAITQIINKYPEAKIIILSAHHDEAYVDHALKAGAVGFLMKQSSASDVAMAIRAVHTGKIITSPSLMRHLNRRYPTTGHKIVLTHREIEVLKLIAEGQANKKIAGTLNISLKTVEKHREHLMQKLDIHDTASLTRYAISIGLIESSVQLTIIPT